jgi:hypothetical protein
MSVEIKRTEIAKDIPYSLIHFEDIIYEVTLGLYIIQRTLFLKICLCCVDS